MDEAYIDDAFITSAKILDLSADKITTGDLDATHINVLNLDASNIVAGTINGYAIGPGQINLSRLQDGVL